MSEESGVTFEDIRGAWVGLNACKPTQGQRRAFWEWLTEQSQPSRWFRACQHAVHNADNTTLTALWSTAMPTLKDLRALESDCRDPTAHGMIEAHAQCAQLAYDLQPTAPSPHRALFDQLSRRLQMPCGFFYDLTMHLLQRPREPEYTYTVPVLLIETNSKKGIVAYLCLELLANGEGQLWPDPALAFVPRDEDFRGAETAAKTYLEKTQVWRNSYDVRWSLQRADKAPLPRLVGNSLGGALVIGLTTLWALAYAYAGLPRTPAPLLALDPDLHLIGTAVTAALDEEGNLRPVGDIDKKLLAAREYAFIHTIIVAEQPELLPNFVQDPCNPARYLDVSEGRMSLFEVLRVRTVAEALVAFRNSRRNADVSRQALLRVIYECTTQLPVPCGAPQGQVQVKLPANPGDAGLALEIVEASRREDIHREPHAGIPFLALTERGRQSISILTRFNAQLWTLARDTGLFVVSLLLAIGGYSGVDRAFYAGFVVPYYADILLVTVCASLVSILPSSVLVCQLRKSRFFYRHYVSSLEALSWNTSKSLLSLAFIESIPFFMIYLVLALINNFVLYWCVLILCLIAIFVGGLSSAVRFLSRTNGQRHLAIQGGIILLLCFLSVSVSFNSSDIF